MKVLITGSRSWTDYRTIVEAFQKIISDSPVTLISGNCPQGADFLCEKAAKELGWDIELYPADWDKYGKRAGFLRNTEMVELGAELCLAFIHNDSKGASMTVRLAKAKGIPVVEYHRNDLINSGALHVKNSLLTKKEPPQNKEDSFLF